MLISNKPHEQNRATSGVYPCISQRTVGALLIVLLTGWQVSSADEWPQWRGPNRDGVWAETGIVDKFASAQIELKWRVPISSGYSGPTVAQGRVYVTDKVVEPKQIERIHCFDWKTGNKLWSYSYDCKYDDFGYKAGPRASVLVDDGLAYSLGAAGHLFCLDAADGSVVWGRDLKTEYSIRMPNWGIAASPVVEGQLLIVQIGGDNEACVCAFDKKTGQQRWKALPDDASYCAPIVIDQASRRVLVCWTADRALGLDPAGGEIHWEFPTPWEKWPIAIATPVLYENRLLCSDAHKGTFLLELSARTTDGQETLASPQERQSRRPGHALPDFHTADPRPIHLRRGSPGRVALPGIEDGRAGSGKTKPPCRKITLPPFT